MIKDEGELVQFVLTGFKEKILENQSLSKTAKMKLFSVYNLKHILALFEWKGKACIHNKIIILLLNIKIMLGCRICF